MKVEIKYKPIFNKRDEMGFWQLVFPFTFRVTYKKDNFLQRYNDLHYRININFEILFIDLWICLIKID